MKGLNLTTADVRVRLYTNTSNNLAQTLDELGDITNTEASGGGYAAAALGSEAVSATADARGSLFSSANVEWTASGSSISAWRRYVMYINGTVDGLTNPLLGYALGDSNDVDVPATADGKKLSIIVPSTGWFDMKRPA